MRYYNIIDTKGQTHHYTAIKHSVSDDGSLELFFNSNNAFLSIKSWVQGTFEAINSELNSSETFYNPKKQQNLIFI